MQSQIQWSIVCSESSSALTSGYARGTSFPLIYSSGSKKVYNDIKEIYWWHEMNKDIAEFVSQCPNHQQVKVENQKPTGLVQDIAIALWNYEATNMYFIRGLPRFCFQFDSVQVIVDRLKKAAHLFPVNLSITEEDYACSILDRFLATLCPIISITLIEEHY